MGDKTGILWTDHTFNPWIGCTKVSPGCKNCYAARRDARHLHGPEDHWGLGAPRKTMSVEYWEKPLRWAKAAEAEGRRHKVFAASMADIFDAEAPLIERRFFWKLIEATSGWLDWQLVTKRPERIPIVIEEDGLSPDFFLKYRCWLITSTEDQERADLRIPLILWIPAAIHGISAEPLLGPLDLNSALENEISFVVDGYAGSPLASAHYEVKPPRLQWVICGGESGPGARPMHPDWARGLRDQCQAAGVPFFFKQWGEYTPVGEVAGLREHFSFTDGTILCKVGKEVAGASLDGIELMHFPEVQI